MGAGFLKRLPGILRHPLDLEQSRAVLRHRLARREDDFLRFARQAIYAQPTNPYRALLRLAGCELGDLERLVRQEGLEGALGRLLRAGVYLTVDELRGRQPARRGSASLTVDPRRLRNPSAQHHLGKRSGGTRARSCRSQSTSARCAIRPSTISSSSPRAARWTGNTSSGRFRAARR
jgi:hypothetical protein